MNDNQEFMGDAVNSLMNHPELKEKFLMKFPCIKKQVEEDIKDREDIEKFLNE